MRAAIRWARGLRAIRPLVETLDRVWWARTVLRADVVDMDFVRAQGTYANPRAAVRAYVSGGFRAGMSLNPLFSEKLVASQLSDVGRVPALYAYLVNDMTRIRVSVNWDALAYASRHPDSALDTGGPLGHAWRAARSSGTISFGPGNAPTAVGWTRIHTAAIEASRRAHAKITDDEGLPIPRTALTAVCIVGENEPDLAFTLDQFIELAATTPLDLVIAHQGSSPSDWTDTTLLTLWMPRACVVHADENLLHRLEGRGEGRATLVVRGPEAEISAADLGTLVRSGIERPSAPLWLDIDGTVASAGVMTHEGRSYHLLAGHPPEDARMLGAEIPTDILAGATYARPMDAGPHEPPVTLTTAVVRAAATPAPLQPPRRESPPAIDASALLTRAGFAVDGWATQGPILSRPRRWSVLPDGRRVPALRWAIKIAAPPGRPGEYWGETHFARGLADALHRLGQDVVIDAYPARRRSTSHLDDVELALRGPEPFNEPRAPHSILWVISHPDEVTRREMTAFEHVFAASAPWAHEASRRFGRPVAPLLQCTDVRRFHPTGLSRNGRRIFVGTARGIVRPSVVEPIRAGLPVSVYGPDWTGFIPASSIVARSVPNEQLPALYESADAVLNDHWPAMRAAGFLSNRLFDVVAAGGRAISDDVEGMSDVFAGAVWTYAAIPDLLSVLRDDLDLVFPSDEDLSRIGERVRKSHSFDARAEELLATVTGRPTIETGRSRR